MSVRARELRFAVDLAGSGALSDENGVRLGVPEEWTPEHRSLAKAERDCFVGASLAAKPRHRWTVNGRPAA